MDIKIIGLSIFMVAVIAFFIFWVVNQKRILRDPEKVLKMVEIYINEKLFSQAKADLKRAIKINPNNEALQRKLSELEN